MSWSSGIEATFEQTGGPVVARVDAPVLTRPPSGMSPISVVIPFCRADKDQAIRLLTWIAEMGQQNARCYLIAPKACDPEGLLKLAWKAFKEAVAWIDNEDIQCNWQHQDPNMMKSAEGPNSLFRQAAWNISMMKLGPWLFLEPDSAPMVPDWLEQLGEEYLRAGRPFMGDRVDESTHPGKIGLTVHMSGVAVYPERVPALAPNAVSPSPTAFDVLGAGQIIPQAHFGGELITHRFRAPSFINWQDVERRINPKCVIFHASKDGSLIRLLREKRNGGDAQCQNSVPTVVSHTTQVNVAGSGAATVQSAAAPISFESQRAQAFIREVERLPENIFDRGNPVCDIFIKTYPKDHEWLRYCLRSIAKYATGFRRIIIVSSEPPAVDNPNGEMFVQMRDREPGYLWQQSVKLHADQHTDADLILYMDSDCLFMRPVTPSDFTEDGKPRWEYGHPREDQKVWFPVMEKFIGRKPKAEFMRRHPFMVPRRLLEQVRVFCEYKHGVELSEYIMAQAVPGNPLALAFSEWNCLGFFAHEFHHENLAWVEEGSAGWQPDCVRQFHSHGGLKPEHRAEMETILTDEAKLKVKWFAGDKKRFSNGNQSITQDSAIQCLVNEASKSNIAKARVLKAIKQAGLVKGGKLQTA